ncbi:MAG: hypothetical protein RMJ53_08600, partial [Chitinophagales bacterium]|nr:hypothetical protein [Chitinophagales bacterium]
AVLHQCFLIIAVDESSVSVSGCAIDRSVHFVKETALKHKVDFFNRFLIYVLKNEEIFIHKWKELWLLKQKGQIDETDEVFNIWTTRLGEWRYKQLIPLSESPARSALLSTPNEISFTL